MSLDLFVASREARAAHQACNRQQHIHRANALWFRSLLILTSIIAACGKDSEPARAGISAAGTVSVIIPAGGAGVVVSPTGVAGTSTSNAAGTGAGFAGRSGAAGATMIGGAGGPPATPGTAGAPSTMPTGPTTPPPPAGSCAMSADRVRITEVDVGSPVLTGDSDQTFFMLAISPIASGGSRIAWLTGDNNIHIAQLDAADHLVGAPFTIPGHDFSDIYADDKGGVVLVTRDAQGGGTLNCGNINNLCGNSASYPTTYACYDMYMVRFEGTTETWATKLTDSNAMRPPYGASPTDANRTTFIWSWYGHHGRIASDGTRWAGYYGSSLSGSSKTLTQANCAQSDSTLTVGIDVHQGDQMRVVDANGAIQMGGFDWGCSHSYYERIVFDPMAKKFVQICETDASNQLLFAPPTYGAAKAIYAIDMQREIGNYSNISNVVVGSQGGYWVTVSKSRTDAAGMADVHLLHWTTGAPDKDLIISNDAMLNNRSNHLAKYGSSRLLASWENASTANDFSPRTAGRKFYVQTHNAATGDPEGGPYQVAINGNRYYEFRDYPDGSVAYPTLGSTNTKISILRVLPCN
jgi:hypothetical protein